MKSIRNYTIMAVMLTLLFGINTVYAAPYDAHTSGNQQAYSHSTVSQTKAPAVNNQQNGIVTNETEPCGQQVTIIPMGGGHGVIFVNGKGTFVDGVSLSNQAQQLACS